MTVLEQLRKTIEDGHPGETEKLVREAILNISTQVKNTFILISKNELQ